MAEAPHHLDGAWRFIPLIIKDGSPQPGPTRAANPAYWEGSAPDWHAFTEWVDNSKGGPIGLLVERSGLVVVDCDVKRYDGSGFVVNGNTAAYAPGETRYGITDLVRVAAEHGEAVAPTYTVKTKSGGYHLYYRQNPRLPVSSRGHRDGWLIDIKASRNSWVVSPPSAGYTVHRDLPVAEMPFWLARYVHELHKHRHPLGGESRRRMMEWSLTIKHHLEADSDDGSLFKRWCNALLRMVSDSNKHGGWNNTIYLTAHEFFDIGLTVEEVLPMLMAAAQPDGDNEAANVVRTVNSAWRKHHWSTGYEGEVQ